jgi:hypothetical protein
MVITKGILLSITNWTSGGLGSLPKSKRGSVFYLPPEIIRTRSIKGELQ